MNTVFPKLKSFLGFFFKTKRRVVIVILIVGGIVVARGIVARRSGDVESTQVMRGNVKEELILTGEINADEYAQLKYPTSGKVAWVGVSEGDLVKSGQALVKLDTTVLNATFQQARATLRAAEAAVENVRDQVKDNDDDESFEEKDTRTAAETTKDKAYDAYLVAEYNLRNSTLTTPFDGIVTYLATPFSGVNVLFSKTQVEVVNPKTIYFDVSADQSEVGDLRVGQRVAIILDSFSDDEFEGKVDFISFAPKSGEVGTVYKVKVTLAGDFSTDKLRIGMTGDAKFILSEKQNIIYAPPKFINADTKGKYVNKNKKNNKVYIDVGVEGEERVEIVSDEVQEGDTIYD